jgi:hypothetical protein
LVTRAANQGSRLSLRLVMMSCSSCNRFEGSLR